MVAFLYKYFFKKADSALVSYLVNGPGIWLVRLIKEWR